MFLFQKGTHLPIMELFFHQNERNWYLRCSLAPPSLFYMFLRGALANLIIHVGFLKEKQHKVTYYCYVLMEFAHHYLYQWFRGCESIQPTLLSILIPQAFFYILYESMFGEKRSIIHYYSHVIFTLFRFYTNHIYDTAHSDIIFCLCCYVVENSLLNRDREKEQDMEAAAVEDPAEEAAAEEAAAEEAPAEIEDNGEDNDEGDEEDNDEGEEEGQMEDHRALRAPKPILFPGEG